MARRHDRPVEARDARSIGTGEDSTADGDVRSAGDGREETAWHVS